MSEPSHSFSPSELQLLTASSDEHVSINTPKVPPESASLYPKLVGSNWDCYITTDSIVLGRSPGPDAPQQARTRNDNRKVDIDFGSHRRDVSRRHAEIRFHKDKWILRIYGKNGAKVNHVLRKPKSPPVTLSNLSLIEIVGHTFVFVLPKKPSAPAATATASTSNTSRAIHTGGSSNNDAISHGAGSRASGAGPLLLREFDQDGQLEAMITEILRAGAARDTESIVAGILEKSQSYDKSAVLHALVLSDKFHLAENQWSLVQDSARAAAAAAAASDGAGVSSAGSNVLQAPALGIGIMDIYTTWLDARELAAYRTDVATPASSSTISAGTSRRAHGSGTPREGVKRQRSDLG